MDINLTLIEIGEFLTKFRCNEFKSPASLMNGGLGKIIYLGHLYKIGGDKKYKRELIHSLGELNSHLEDHTLTTNLFIGYAGLGWTLQHLINLGVISSNQFVDLDELDEVISYSIDNDFQVQNLDLFEGLIGKGIYFLARGNRIEDLAIISNNLISLGTADQFGFSWKDTITESYNSILLNKAREKGNYLFNLGLAHGIPSIISFLCLLYQADVNRHEISRHIEMAAKWLLSFKKTNATISYPHYLDCDYEYVLYDKSSLAWCYGDLSVAVALLHSHKVTQNPIHYAEGIDIARKAAQRDILNSNILHNKEAQLVNTGFCHGVSGVSHIFFRIYQYTKEPIFKTAFEYWNNLLFKYRRPIQQGMAGFLSYELDPDLTVFENDATLLDGVAGIGLTLLSQHSPEVKNWDSIFLTNL